MSNDANHKQWEPLTTAEAVIEAFKAGRHVEFTFCGNDYESQGGGWIVPLPDRSEPDGVREAFRLGGGRRYRALIAPAQPAADVDTADAELADAIAKGTEAVPVGEMDRTAPPEVWMQIDTEGDSEDRSQPIPRDSWGDLTWCAESIGGQEVRYIRADLAGAPPAPAVDEAMVELVKKLAAVPIENFDSRNVRSDDHPLIGMDSWTLTVGDVRKARAALTAALQEPEA